MSVACQFPMSADQELTSRKWHNAVNSQICQNIPCGTVPGSPPRFEFEGKEPLAFWIVHYCLRIPILRLLLSFAGKHFLPQNALETVRWYEANSITIQFVLSALLV